MRGLIWWLVPAVAACDAASSTEPAPSCPAAIGEAVVPGDTVRFARAVAAGPDADGDGHPDVVVGEPSENQTTDHGRVHLLSGATGAVVRTWSAEEVADGFGAAVALGPDADGDGRADVVIGAPGHDGFRGRAYLYSGGSGELLQRWDGEPQARLGAAVSLGPDADGDGRGDVVVADQLAYDEVVDVDVVYAKVGRVHLYAGATGATLQRFEAAERNASYFGATAVLGPDADGDGRGDVLITEPRAIDERTRAHLRSGATGALLHTWERPADTYYYASAAAIGPDTDGDGAAEVAIAMTSRTSREEIVVLHSGATGAPLQTWRDDNWRVLREGKLAVTGDLDGDGRGEVVIATDAVIADAGAPSIATYVYAGATGAELARWSHAEHRNFLATGSTAVPDGDGCGGLVVIGVAEHHPLDGPLSAAVELRRLAP